MLTPELRRKRAWEIVSGLVLLLVLAGTGGAYLRYLAVNHELARAIERSDWKRAGALLKQGADPHTRGLDGATVLMLAAKTGNIDLLRQGLTLGLDPNAVDHQQMTPLMWAAGHGSLPVAEALLAAGADRRARTPDGYTALTFALPNGKDVVVRDPANQVTTTFHRPTQSARLWEVYRFLRQRSTL